MSLGPANDYYQMYISVNIVDDFNGITTFTIPSPVNVTADSDATNSLIDSIISSDASSTFLKSLQSGDLKTVAKNVIALASTLNSMIYDETSISNSSSNNTLSSGSSGSNSNSSSSSFSEQQRNQKAEAREALMNFVAQIPVSSASSAKVLSSTISVLTRKTSEINMNTAVINSTKLIHLF